MVLADSFKPSATEWHHNLDLHKVVHCVGTPFSRNITILK